MLPLSRAYKQGQMLTRPAESSRVAPALWPALLLRDVEVHALVSRRAEAVLCEEVALGHLAEVVLVEVLAVCSLLAQPSQPVLAHCASLQRARDHLRLVVQGGRRRVPQRTACPSRTPSGTVECSADLRIRIELDPRSNLALDAALEEELSVQELGEHGHVALRPARCWCWCCTSSCIQ